MLTASNPAIGLYSRQLLRQLASSGDLDADSEELLLRALEKTRPRSHAGWVYALAEALGAPRAIALQAGSFAELCCGAIDLIDDVQDGDAGRTLGGAPLPVQVNVSSHMLVIGVLAAERLQRELGAAHPGLVREAYRLFSAMASGQRMEVTRQDWSPRRYEQVAALTCGKQYELYLRTAAFAAGVDVSPWLPLAEPLGVATQIACDLLASDSRLLAFPAPEVAQMQLSWSAAARNVLDTLPAAGASVLREMSRFPVSDKRVDAC